MYVFCSICQDLLSFEKGPVLALICGHVYHKNCIEKWIKRNRSCPICKDFIGNEKLQRLFFSFREDDPRVSKLQNKVNKLNDFIKENVKELELMDIENNRKNIEIEKKDKKIKHLKQKLHELSDRIAEMEIHFDFDSANLLHKDKENSVMNQKHSKSLEHRDIIEHPMVDCKKQSETMKPEKTLIVKQLFVDSKRRHHTHSSRLCSREE